MKRNREQESGVYKANLGKVSDIPYCPTSPTVTLLNLEVDRIFRHSTIRLPQLKWTSAYIKARARCFKLSSIESGFRKTGIYPFYPEILLSTLTSSLRTPSPGNQVVSQVSDASRILRARGSPCTPKALNLRQIVDLVQNDRDNYTNFC
jgi:hypothetical protein